MPSGRGGRGGGGKKTPVNFNSEDCLTRLHEMELSDVNGEVLPHRL
jgi:hypothetical protein